MLSSANQVCVVGSLLYFAFASATVFALNNRYGSDQLTTHNKEKIDHCIILDNLKDLDENLLNDTDVIIIEELQFFSDAYETVVEWCDVYKKSVIAAGLDGDFLKNPFGSVLWLIPHAE